MRRRSYWLIVFLILMLNISASFPQRPKKVLPLSETQMSKMGEKCEVHGEILKLDTVPIRYGLIKFGGDYYKIILAEFPNANSGVLGGCIVMEETDAEVLYCAKCRDAEARWQKEHRHR